MRENRLRRVASNEVIYNQQSFPQCVVEIRGEHVVRYWHFENELPKTEWLGGEIKLVKQSDGCLQAFYHNRLLTS